MFKPEYAFGGCRLRLAYRDSVVKKMQKRWILLATVALLLALSATSQGDKLMLERLNPDRLHPPVGQSLIVVANFKRTAYFTANPLDANGNLVGGSDFAKQNEQVFNNIAIALDELGVGPDNIIKMTGYIVNYDASYHGPLIAQGLAKNPADHKYPATMLLGVASLARPDMLFEVGLIIGLD